jgi:hypothetical protein
MDEVIAEREVLRQILVRSVGRHHTEIVLVLQNRWRDEKLNIKSETEKG